MSLLLVHMTAFMNEFIKEGCVTTTCAEASIVKGYLISNFKAYI